MTREEAISWLEPFIWHEGEDVPIYGTDIEAIHIAIKALKQELILDKIRAEIMQLDYDTESVDYDYDDMPQTEIIHTVCREEVLRIIDKYKAESEEEDGNDD